MVRVENSNSLKIMRCATLISALLALFPRSYAATASATHDEFAVMPEVVRTSDAAGYKTTGWNLTWSPRFRDSDHLFGIVFGQVTHRQDARSDRETPGARERSDALLGFAWRAIDSRDDTGSELTVVAAHSSDHDRLQFNARHARVLDADTRLEVFADRTALDTQIGLERHLQYTNGGVGIERRLGSRFTGLATVSWQRFSDDGARRTLRGGLVFYVAPDAGINLQWRGRWLDTERRGAIGGYFEPDHYTEHLLLLGWNRRFASMQWRLRVGAGQQRADGGRWQDARRADLEVRFNPSRARQWSLQYVYANAADRVGPDTDYRSFKLRGWMTF